MTEAIKPVPQRRPRMSGDELRARVENLEAERQAVLDVVNIYGDEVLHSALDAIGWPWGDGSDD